MESVLGRYRNLIILVLVLFLQVLGLAVQVKRGGNDSENTRLIRVWAVDAVTPFERGIVWLQTGCGNLWHNYFYLRGVRAENRQLKEQIEQMRLEQVRLSEDAAQAHRLQNLLAFKEQYISKTVAAQVIGSSGSDLSRMVYIDKGEDAGLKRDMAVITADGVVGKLMLVYASTAQVLLINDQTSGVGVILENSRLQGVLRGTANGEVVLERVMSDEQVAPGEKVLTSGGDQIFPKGLPVGIIMKVGSGKDLFLNIRVKPAADLSKLEEVLVLVEKQDRQALADDSTRMRAADILAQRLPSVPDKPAVDPKAPPASGTAAGRPPTTTAAKPAVPGGVSQVAKNSATATAASNGSIQVVKGTSPTSAATKPATAVKPSTSPNKSSANTQQSGAEGKPASTSPAKVVPPVQTPPPAQPSDSQPAEQNSPQ